MRPAVEFESIGDELHLLYSPRDDDEWVHAKFDRGETLTIKGTFRLTRAQLVPQDDDGADKSPFDDYPMRFRIAKARGDYFQFDPDVVRVDPPVLLHKDARPTWKWFSSERAVSIIDVIADLKPKRIVIGGSESDAIPIADYETLVAQFPTPFELKRYTLARVASVVRNYVETPVDAEQLYRAYIEKRVRRKARNFRAPFVQQDSQKYAFLLDKLTQMLRQEETYPESVWQEQILQIILLLNPKYIQAIEKVRIRGEGSAHRFLDVLLIDASGNVDVIEIKKPFNKSIVSQSVYRDNHIPLRELSGSVMQVEKYIYRLSRWGHAGEKALTERYASRLPPGFRIRITNPSGIIITGRDQNLTPAQRQDFEFVRRKYKNIVDIITYDDLVRRLEYVVSQLTPRRRSRRNRD
jgi:Shedu protein SduA, C-terminal